MSQLKLSYKVVGEQNNIVVVEMNGFLDGNTCDQLKKALQQIIDKGIKKIIIDCKDLSYISSAGLGIFMFALNSLQENDGKLILINMSSDIYNVFSMLGFTHIYTILNTFEEALQRCTN